MWADSSLSVLRRGNDREKENVWKQMFFLSILQELLSSK